MTDLMMRKKGGRLEPVDQVFAEELASVPVDRDLEVTVKVAKNPKQLRFAWVLAGKIADAFGIDKDSAMDELCRLAHHVDIVGSPTGHVFLRRKSLSKLDGAAFSRLLNRMVYVTCTEILPGLDEGTLRDEIEAMTAPRERVPA